MTEKRTGSRPSFFYSVIVMVIIVPVLLGLEDSAVGGWACKSVSCRTSSASWAFLGRIGQSRKPRAAPCHRAGSVRPACRRRCHSHEKHDAVSSCFTILTRQKAVLLHGLGKKNFPDVPSIPCPKVCGNVKEREKTGNHLTLSSCMLYT